MLHQPPVYHLLQQQQQQQQQQLQQYRTRTNSESLTNLYSLHV